MKPREEEGLLIWGDQRPEIPNSNRLKLHNHMLQHETDSDNEKKTDNRKISFILMTNAKNRMAKSVHLNPDHTGIMKDASQCKMFEGTGKAVSATPEEFAAILTRLEDNQAICSGSMRHEFAQIVTAAKVASTPKDKGPVIARSKNYMSYKAGQPALILFDVDKIGPHAVFQDDTQARSPVEPGGLISILSKIFPEFGSAASVCRYSNSSHIYAEDGRELSGKEAGYHLYLFAVDGLDISRFTDVLFKRLFLNDYGRLESTKDGKPLTRTLFDNSVHSPERLIFEAPTICGPGLVQRLPDPEFKPGGLLDTQQLPDLTAAEEQGYCQIIAGLTAKAQPMLDQIRAEYVNAGTEKLLAESGDTLTHEQAARAVKSRAEGVLQNDDILYFQSEPDSVTVAEVLADPQTYDGQSLTDPLEPEYNGGSRSTAKFYNNDGKPRINSFAHGSTAYRFASVDYPVGIDPVEAFGSLPAAQTHPEPVPPAKIWTYEETLDVLSNRTDLTGKELNEFLDDILKNNEFNEWELDEVFGKINALHGKAKNTIKRRHKQFIEQRLTAENEHWSKNHVQIMDHFVEHDKEIKAVYGKLFKFCEKEGVYQATELDKMANNVARNYTSRYNTKASDSLAIVKMIYAEIKDEKFFDSRPVGIATKTKFYQVEGDRITEQPLAPEQKRTYKAPVDPTSGPLSPGSLLARYLNTALYHKDPAYMNEQIELLQMVCGGMLLGVFAQIQQAVLLLGQGENGKSVLLELMQHFFPEETRAAVKPDKMNDPYSVATLAGKIYNSVGEVDKNKPLDSSFKDIVGSETAVSARLPYGMPFDFVPNCAHLFAGNDFPRTNDHSHGFYRRWRIIKFNNKVDPASKIPHLGRRIAEEEGGMFLDWAIEGAKKLVAARYRLSDTQAHAEALHEWQNEQDSVQAFFDDAETIAPAGPQSVIKTSELYRVYVWWCKLTNCGALRRNKFYSTIRARYDVVKNEVNVLKGYELVNAALGLG